MPSNIKYRDFRRMFERYGVEFDNTHGSSHVVMRRKAVGRTLLYTIPLRSGREVLAVYLKKARRAMNLLPEHGVSDEEFLS